MYCPLLSADSSNCRHLYTSTGEVKTPWRSICLIVSCDQRMARQQNLTLMPVYVTLAGSILIIITPYVQGTDNEHF